MTALAARYLPALLWLAALVLAVYQGVTYPRSTIELPFPIKAPMLAMMFALGVLIVVLFRAQRSRNAALWKRIAEVLGEPLFADLESRVRFPLLAATFFVVVGAIASVGCMVLESPVDNVSFARVPLAVGAGMFLGMAIADRQQFSRSA